MADTRIPPILAFAALPIDARLRCSEVCPSWRAALASAKELWLHVDLSEGSGVTAHVSNALLRCACARAGGDLLSLDISHERKGNKPHAKPKDEACSVTLAGLTGVLRQNALSLQRVRFGILWLKYSEDPLIGFPPAYSHYLVNVEDLLKIQAAAPKARLEAGLDCVVSDHAFDVQCDEGDDSHIPATYDSVMSALRRGAPLAALRLHTLGLSHFLFDRRKHQTETATDKMLAIFDALGKHDSLESISLYCNGELALKDDARSAPFVDACAALPKLRRLMLTYVGLQDGRPLLALARLLASCRKLSSLDVQPGRVMSQSADIFSGPDVPVFCAALRGSSLTELKLSIAMNISNEPPLFANAAAGEAVIAAARESREKMKLTVNGKVVLSGR